MTRLDDEAAFQVADGMKLGSVVNGNLRMIITTKGKEVVVELPFQWLHSELGLAAFIRKKCQGPHKESNTWCLDCGEHHDGSCNNLGGA